MHTTLVRRPCRLLAAVFVVLALPLLSRGPAAAAESFTKPPVKLQLVPPEIGRLPVQGETWAATLRVTSAIAATMRDVAVESPRMPGGGMAWDVVSIGLPPATPVALAPDVPLDVPVELTANDPTVPVVLTIVYDGRRVSDSFLLVPRYGPDSLLGIPATVAYKGALPPALPLAKSAYALPDPAPSRGPRRHAPGARGHTREMDAPAKRSPAGYNIRVHGRFIYTRPDGIVCGVDGATIRVMEEDWDWDPEFAATITLPDGSFDVSFYYDDSESPDIYLAIEAANAKVEVEDASVFEWNYEWESHVEEDTDASDIDFGTFTNGNPDLAPALHILTAATRTYRWFQEADAQVNEDVSAIDVVDIQWPEDAVNPSCYTPAFETIEINSDAQWRELTVAHEYNHHAAEHLYTIEIDDYCNEPERCDDGDDCGHCLWCQETTNDAWGEGFGDWVARSLLYQWSHLYAVQPYDMTALTPSHYRYVQTPHQCDDVSPWTWDDPASTEGNVAGFLLDMEDADNQQGSYPYTGTDELTIFHEQIVAISANDDPQSVNDFIDRFIQLNPDAKPYVWNTARIHGFDLPDNYAPGGVTNLTSSTHPVGIDENRHTAVLTWTTAGDDMSGVDGYSVRVSHVSTDVPDNTKDIGNVTTFTTDDMGTGPSYFTIRAVDRAGRWSTQVVRYGPMVVAVPFEADMRPWAQTGWDYPLVPRAAADATEATVTSPTLLTGDQNATWWNLSVENIGDLPAPVGWDTIVYLDGVWSSSYALPSPLPWANYRKWINRGPMTVRGGRHTLSATTDPYHEYSEMNEFDNEFARQWIWNPATMTLNVAYTRAAPPDRFGGAISTGMFYSYNCDGLRAQAVLGSEFKAVSVRGVNDAADYDCRLHPASAGATEGFSLLGHLAWSSRPAGCLDAVLMRSDTAYDIGIINMNDHWTDYVATRTTSTTLAFDTPTAVTLGAGQYLKLLAFDPVTAQNVTVTVAGAGASPLRLGWVGSDFVTGDLHDFGAEAVTDTTGSGQIGPVAMAAGYQCLALYRDPLDAAPGGGTAPAVTVTVHAFPTRSDLTPNKLPGWAYQCVPRAAADGTATSVPGPSVLTGDAAATWVNAAWHNVGANASPSYYWRAYLDGAQKSSVLYSGLAAGGAVARNSASPIIVPAGRHMLSFRLDPDNTVSEVDDANNGFGRQWVWTPPALALRMPQTRVAPPDPRGGFTDCPVDTGATVYFNCDGVRMPAPSFNGQHGYWQAVATMPAAASDVEPRLFEVVDGADYGFRAARVASAWGPGASDFVLVNYRATAPARAFDVGVLRAAGTDPYTVEAVASSYLGTYPNGRYGPYNLAASHVVNLHEVKLQAGPLAIGLHDLNANVDFGLSLHTADRAFQAKLLESGPEGWVEWQRRTGEGEWIVLDVPVSGFYCLAVWKTDAGELARDGRYELEFIDGLTDVPGALPEVSRLAGVRPNPFNPSTTIAWEVASAGRVQLAVYDLAGRCVRVLHDGPVAPGRRTATWDGTDGRGQRVASGVYLVRLVAPDGEDRRTVTLVK